MKSPGPKGPFYSLFSLVKIEHTLFALPLALTGAILGARGLPSILTLLLMAFNRIADRHLDVQNPRTANREIPSGTLSVTRVWGLVTAVVIGIAGIRAKIYRYHQK
ncbi:dimethylallyltranstransferase domain protein [delta proteobacterium NaphS2]|nr:dimethylallyltranstransferase domain protein [delta proteobacterium NaphS2]